MRKRQLVNFTLMQDLYTIASRYVVDITRNTVTDLHTNTSNKVEQRLITVLCLLADQPKKLVSRDTLIKEVWNDYGGADEALTQAISFLRKLLNDADKTLIETVPKKGYILHADIIGTAPGGETLEEKPENAAPASNKKKYIVIALGVILITSTILFFTIGQHSESPDLLHSDPTHTNIEDTIRSRSPDIRPHLQKDSIKMEDIKQ